jgi:hypothetical protein
MRAGLVLVLFLSAFTTCALAAQQGSTWVREEKSDPLHKTAYSEFTLEGKYLVPPKDRNAEAPMLILQCKEDAHNRDGGKASGRLLAGFLDVDAALDFREGNLPVEFRLDDGKLQEADWSSSNDSGGATFGYKDFEKLLYGHTSSHKEDTSPAVRKVILGVPEHLGTEIEAEFDMPDPGEVAEVCGVVGHKK